MTTEPNPTASTRMWPDAECGPWSITFHWAVLDARVECVGIEVRSVSRPPTPVTTSLFRAVPLGGLMDEERRSFATEPTWTPVVSDDGWQDRVADAAAVYQHAFPTGNPTKAVADQLSVSRAAAAKLVERARQRGLLPPTSRGRAAGGPASGEPRARCAYTRNGGRRCRRWAEVGSVFCRYHQGAHTGTVTR